MMMMMMMVLLLLLLLMMMMMMMLMMLMMSTMMTMMMMMKLDINTIVVLLFTCFETRPWNPNYLQWYSPHELVYRISSTKKRCFSSDVQKLDPRCSLLQDGQPVLALSTWIAMLCRRLDGKGFIDELWPRVTSSQPGRWTVHGEFEYYTK